MEHDRDVNAAKNILRQGLSNVYSPERCLTNVEMEALVIVSNNDDETTINETLKKKLKNRKVVKLKPLGL